jgi:two-component system, chemotaxis family, response regulator PixG
MNGGIFVVQLSVSASKPSIQSFFNVADAIQHHLQQSLSGYLKINGGDISGFAYFHHGKLAYITHSVAPVTRLDLYLKDLSDCTPTLSIGLRNQLRLALDPTANLEFHLPADFQGIAALLQNRVLSAAVAQSLIETLSREALESLLLLQNSTYTFFAVEHSLDWVQPLNFDQLLNDCTERLEAWKNMRSHILSPYQRPYLRRQTETIQDSWASGDDTRLFKLLKGFSFRHLAILTHQDELDVARKLYPLILDDLIVLRTPQPPFHELPSFLNLDSATALDAASLFPMYVSNKAESSAKPELETGSLTIAPSKTYRVACIDDSFAILQAIEQFLGAQHIALFLIQDSVKALAEVMSIDPDVILLDSNLPGVDGYEICRLLRKHPRFNVTPIIIMTSNNGLVDRAQAIMAGATDFIAKPFTQPELSKAVFRHLPIF